MKNMVSIDSKFSPKNKKRLSQLTEPFCFVAEAGLEPTPFGL